MDRINNFSTFLKDSKGQKDGTIRTNLKLIKKVLREFSTLDAQNSLLFIDRLIAQRMAPSTIKQYVTILRHWGDFTKNEELSSLPYPQIKYKSAFRRDTFADHEVIAFLSLKNPYTRTHKCNGRYRERYEMWMMFYSILFYHGLRTVEIARLEVDMFDFGLDVIDLPGRITKTKDPRRVPISPIIRDKLYTFVNSIEGTFLFPPFHESSKLRGIKHVGENDWNRFFKLQMKRLGIKRKNLTPYSGRHTYGTRQAEQDVSLKKIGEIMGHKRESTTAVYVHLSLNSLKEVQQKDRIRRAFMKPKEKRDGVTTDLRKLCESWGIPPSEQRAFLKKMVEGYM